MFDHILTTVCCGGVGLRIDSVFTSDYFNIYYIVYFELKGEANTAFIPLDPKVSDTLLVNSTSLL